MCSSSVDPVTGSARFGSSPLSIQATAFASPIVLLSSHLLNQYWLSSVFAGCVANLSLLVLTLPPRARRKTHCWTAPHVLILTKTSFSEATEICLAKQRFADS